MVASFSHVIGICILLAAPPAAVFILGRMFIGVALGIITAISGAYLNEASSPALRGSIFSILQQLLTIGTVSSNGINWATKSLPGANSWRISVGFQFLISIIIFSAGFIAPESPSVLVHWGRSCDAAKSLAITQGIDASSDEIRAIIKRLEDDRPTTSSTSTKTESSGSRPAQQPPTFLNLLSESFRGTALRRTLLVAAVSALCLLTGFVFWTSYGTTFLADAGVSDAYMVSFILALVQCLSTVPSIWLTDILGRRTLLLAGTSIMGLVLLLAGLLYTVLPHGSAHATQMLVAAAIIFMFAYGSTWGPVTWLVMAEPVSSRHRLPQTTVTFVVYWLTYLVISFATPFLVDKTAVNMGPYITYLWFGGVVVSLVWIYMCVPELTGLSQTEIDMLFEERVPAWRSKQWKRALRSAQEAEVEVARGEVLVMSAGAGGNCEKGVIVVHGGAGKKEDGKGMVVHGVKEVDSSSDSD